MLISSQYIHPVRFKARFPLSEFVSGEIFRTRITSRNFRFRFASRDKIRQVLRVTLAKTEIWHGDWSAKKGVAKSVSGSQFHCNFQFRRKLNIID